MALSDIEQNVLIDALSILIAVQGNSPKQLYKQRLPKVIKRIKRVLDKNGIFDEKENEND